MVKHERRLRQGFASLIKMRGRQETNVDIQDFPRWNARNIIVIWLGGIPLISKRNCASSEHESAYVSFFPRCVNCRYVLLRSRSAKFVIVEGLCSGWLFTWKTNWYRRTLYNSWKSLHDKIGYTYSILLALNVCFSMRDTCMRIYPSQHVPNPSAIFSHLRSFYHKTLGLV